MVIHLSSEKRTRSARLSREQAIWAGAAASEVGRVSDPALPDDPSTLRLDELTEGGAGDWMMKTSSSRTDSWIRTPIS